MNVRATSIAARSTGHSTRRTANRTVKTAKTAAHVGYVAVTGFLAGFFAGPAVTKRGKKRRSR